MTQTYLIGIDTGGTYTDAVVIAAHSHEVIASAKALTTRGDLAHGVREAMGKAMAALPDGFDAKVISLVSVSTTMATNAVVEGHGSTVCSVLIGFDGRMAARSGIAAAFAGMPTAVIAGGHDHNGEESSALDEAALEKVIAEHGNKVEAFAVAAQFAVRNPQHEIRAREIIVARTGKPVSVSSELSSALDAPRRALTTTLNARLIARISRLIAAVFRAMAEHRIGCPLMIVKGDGTLALAETVASRPIETVLSGPAASVVGAKWLSGIDTFIMADMGGTTTDVGILQHGRPRVAEEGAEVGGWRTMVKAIDIKTVGLGGDSEVIVGVDGAMAVGPQRLVPVSLLAAQFPVVTTALEMQLAEPEVNSLAGRFIMLPAGAGEEAALKAGGLSQRETEIMKRVTATPVALAEGCGERRRPAGGRCIATKGLCPGVRFHAFGCSPCSGAAEQLVRRGGREGGSACRSLPGYENADCGANPALCPRSVVGDGAPRGPGAARCCLLARIGHGRHGCGNHRCGVPGRGGRRHDADCDLAQRAGCRRGRAGPHLLPRGRPAAEVRSGLSCPL